MRESSVCGLRIYSSWLGKPKHVSFNYHLDNGTALEGFHDPGASISALGSMA